MRTGGKLLVVSGPSGVGKDTLINLVVASSDFVKFPTCTTRQPREGEINGIHYFFMDETAFLSLWKDGQLLDHVEITGQHYGLMLGALRKKVETGQNVIVHLVVDSALLLKEKIPEAILVFVLPPSYDELIYRLRQRGMSEVEIKARIRADSTDLDLLRLYDLVVVNYDGEKEETVRHILEYIPRQNNPRSPFQSYLSLKGGREKLCAHAAL